jgi:two-component system cell cycle response regulator CpdR
MQHDRAPIRILLVDDDEGVRDFAREVLLEQGHEVTVATDGVEALDALEKSGGGFDLLVTDVVMPGLNGFSLASLVKGRWPEIKVLYLTGFYDLAQADMGERYGEVLKKPFRPRQLGTEVKRALAA